MKPFAGSFFIRWLQAVLLCALAACTPSATEPTIFKGKTSTVHNQIAAAQQIQLVNNYLQQQFPGWRLAQPADYSKSWWSFYDSSTVTQPAVTDINDDRKADYGLLLIKEDSVQLVFLLGAGDSFTHWVAPHFQANYSAAQNNLEYSVVVEPPGQIDIAYPSIQSLVVPSNAFNLMQLEKRVSIYHYINGTMSVFKTQ